MKKVLIIMLSLVMVLGLAGCNGGEEGEKAVNENKVAEENFDNIEEQLGFGFYEDQHVSGWTASTRPEPKIQCIDSLFLIKDEIGVIESLDFYTKLESGEYEPPKDLQEAFERMKVVFEYGTIEQRIEAFNVTSDSYETINGIDMYRFEGTLTCNSYKSKGQHEAYMIGAVYIDNGMSVGVLGSVLDEKGDPEKTEKVKLLVNYIVNNTKMNDELQQYLDQEKIELEEAFGD